MARYKILAKANADIEKMYADGIKTWGLEQAQDYLLGLHDYFEFLADNPNIGINSDDLALNLQRFPYRRHMVFFVNTDARILIVRVLGSEMDFERHL